MKLKLTFWSPTFARQHIPELESPKPILACWLGSASKNDKSSLAEFLSSAQRADLQSIVQFQQIGGDLVYGVLLKLEHSQWKLVVIESPEDPSTDERCIFSSVIPVNIDIEIDQTQKSDVEARLRENCSLRFRDIIKEFFKI